MPHRTFIHKSYTLTLNEGQTPSRCEVVDIPANNVEGEKGGQKILFTHQTINITDKCSRMSHDKVCIESKNSFKGKNNRMSFEV